MHESNEGFQETQENPVKRWIEQSPKDDLELEALFEKIKIQNGDSFTLEVDTYREMNVPISRHLRFEVENRQFGTDHLLLVLTCTKGINWDIRDKTYYLKVPLDADIKEVGEHFLDKYKNDEVFSDIQFVNKNSKGHLNDVIEIPDENAENLSEKVA